MISDTEHLGEFVKAGREGGDALDEYLRRHVREPEDHDGYLETIGIRRVVSLLI
jgi:hypothetical protein